MKTIEVERLCQRKVLDGAEGLAVPRVLCYFKAYLFTEISKSLTVESRYIGQILRPCGCLFVPDEMGATDHWKCLALDLDHHTVRPCLIEPDAVNGRKNVDSSRRHTDLKHHVRGLKIVEAEVKRGRPEAPECAPDALGIVLRVSNPEVEVACGAWETMRRECVGADHQEFSAFGIQRGQHVAEVGIQQPGLP